MKWGDSQKASDSWDPLSEARGLWTTLGGGHLLRGSQGASLATNSGLCRRLGEPARSLPTYAADGLWGAPAYQVPSYSRQPKTLTMRREKIRQTATRAGHRVVPPGRPAYVVSERPTNVVAPTAERSGSRAPIERLPETGVGGFCGRKDTAFLSGCRGTFPVPRILLVRLISGKERDQHPTARVRETARQKIRHVSRSTCKRSGAQGNRFVAARRAAKILDKPRNNAGPGLSRRDP